MLEILKKILEGIKEFPRIITSSNNVVVDGVELNDKDIINAFKNIEINEKNQEKSSNGYSQEERNNGILGLKFSSNNSKKYNENLENNNFTKTINSSKQKLGKGKEID